MNKHFGFGGKTSDRVFRSGFKGNFVGMVSLSLTSSGFLIIESEVSKTRVQFNLVVVKSNSRTVRWLIMPSEFHVSSNNSGGINLDGGLQMSRCTRISP